MKRKTKVYIYNAIVIALIITGLVWVLSKFIHLGNVEFTDNAQIRRQITPVNSRVNGFIKEIRFDEYQPVHKGDTLLVIDDTEFKLALAQAESHLANAIAGQSAGTASIQTITSNIGVSAAAIEEAKANLEVTKRQYDRYASLLSKKAVTQSEYDQAYAAYQSAQARVDGLRLAQQSTTLTRGEQSHRVEQSESAVRAAEAAVEMAKVNLSYTVVLAPCDGITGKKSINQGQLVHPGQTLVDIVDSSDVWVVANFRESQLKHIERGSSVDITVDAYPDLKLQGNVVSLANATGSAVSMIPTDNATGNFVKVEQRIPVRIDFDGCTRQDLDRLRAGMNVECEIKY